MQGAWVQSLVREIDPTYMLQPRVHMPQLRSLPAVTKTWSNQINKYFFKKDIFKKNQKNEFIFLVYLWGPLEIITFIFKKGLYALHLIIHLIILFGI